MPVPSFPALRFARLLPLDLYPLMKGFINKAKPRVLLIAETEIWPNMLVCAAAAGTRICVINGRLSPRTLGLYRFLSPLTARIFAGVEKVLAQGDADAARYALRLGVREVHMVYRGTREEMRASREELEGALEEGMGFDGSSIEGFARIDESDMIAVPDPNTFALLPWRPRENAVARMFCDIKRPGGKPFDGDPRHVLKRNLERAAKLGYTFYVGPELEFFVFKSAEAPVPPLWPAIRITSANSALRRRF